jgi:hypothetical protein
MRRRHLISVLGVAILAFGVSSASSAATSRLFHPTPDAVLSVETIFGWATPTIVADPDERAVEIGTKFRVKGDGLITGIRYYKSAENVGRHVGSLWDSTGHRLGSITFDNETESGWQLARLGWPVRVSADRTYIVSYFAPHGRYAADPY